MRESVLTVNAARRYTAVFHKPSIYIIASLLIPVFSLIPVYRASLSEIDSHVARPSYTWSVKAGCKANNEDRLTRHRLFIHWN